MLKAASSSAFAAWVLLAAPAVATVYVPADLSELTARAGSIVHGHVVVTEARWAPGRRAIETLVTVAVEQPLKGPAGRTVSLRVPGGRMGAYQTIMPGAPVFREGDEVVLFLASSGAGDAHLVGLGQGVFRVSRDPATGERVVTPALAVSPGGPPARLVRGDPRRRPTPLAAFAARVRALSTGAAR